MSLRVPKDPHIPGMPNLSRWLKDLRDYVESITPQSTPTVRIEHRLHGTLMHVKKSSGGGSDDPRFEVYSSSALGVKVRGGRVTWHEKTFDLQNEDYNPSDEIAVPAETEDFIVYLQMDNEFTPEEITFQGTAGGWDGYPEQPQPFAVKYFPLAKVTSGATSISSIKLFWSGGDILWPGHKAFWL